MGQYWIPSDAVLADFHWKGRQRDNYFNGLGETEPTLATRLVHRLGAVRIIPKFVDGPSFDPAGLLAFGVPSLGPGDTATWTLQNASGVSSNKMFAALELGSAASAALQQALGATAKKDVIGRSFADVLTLQRAIEKGATAKGVAAQKQSPDNWPDFLQAWYKAFVGGDAQRKFLALYSWLRWEGVAAKIAESVANGTPLPGAAPTSKGGGQFAKAAAKNLGLTKVDPNALKAKKIGGSTGGAKAPPVHRGVVTRDVQLTETGNYVVMGTGVLVVLVVAYVFARRIGG